MSESERESAAAAKEGARAMGMLCHHHETRAPNPAAPLRQCPGSTRYATQARDRDMRIKTNSQQPAASKHRGGGGGSTLMPARRRRQVGKPGCRLAAAGKSLAEICLFALAPKKDEEESWKKATKGGRSKHPVSSQAVLGSFFFFFFFVDIIIIIIIITDFPEYHHQHLV